MAFNEEEKNINFTESEVDDLYEIPEDEELEDDDEETGSQVEEGIGPSGNSQNKKKNMLIIGGLIGLIAVFGVLSLPKMLSKNKQQKETTQISQGPVNNGETPDGKTQQETLAYTEEQEQANQIIPCDVNNLNNPANQNNPECHKLGIGTPAPGTDPNTIQGTLNDPNNPNSFNNNNPNGTATNTSGTVTNGEYVEPVQNYNQPVVASQPVRTPKREKQLPTPPAQYQAKQIAKPNSALGNSSQSDNNQNRNNNNNQALTTNGVQGQTQQQADAINNTQQRVRPTNEAKKADNINTFLMQSGTYIPLAMTTTLNSDNPSFFMGIVRENVYTQNGMHKLLIPKGSRVIGNYQALSSNTATRMFMFVEKIILPNQEVIAFSNVNVVDLKGEIGTKGHLNGKFWQRLGGTTLALTFSAADLAFEYRKLKTAEKIVDKDAATAQPQSWEGLIGTPSTKVKEIITTLSDAWKAPKNRIKVPIGYRLNVLVLDELVLPEYKGR